MGAVAVSAVSAGLLIEALLALDWGTPFETPDLGGTRDLLTLAFAGEGGTVPFEILATAGVAGVGAGAAFRFPWALVVVVLAGPAPGAPASAPLPPGPSYSLDAYRTLPPNLVLGPIKGCPANP